MSSSVHHSLAPENHRILYLWSTSHFIHQFSLRRPYKRSSLHQESTSSHISRLQGQPQVVPWRLVLPWQLGAMTHARWWATLTPLVALCLIEIDMASSIATSNLVQERSPPRWGFAGGVGSCMGQNMWFRWYWVKLNCGDSICWALSLVLCGHMVVSVRFEQRIWMPTCRRSRKTSTWAFGAVLTSTPTSIRVLWGAFLQQKRRGRKKKIKKIWTLPWPPWGDLNCFVISPSRVEVLAWLMFVRWVEATN